MHLPGKFVEICKSLPCGETGAVADFGLGVPELHCPIEIFRHRFSIDLFFSRKVDWLPYLAVFENLPRLPRPKYVTPLGSEN